MDKDPRGYTIVLVLVAITIMTIVGTSLLFQTDSEQKAAAARERAAIARQVAEAGLTSYALEVQPRFVPTVTLPEMDEDETGYRDHLEGIAPLFAPREVPAPPGFRATYVVWAISHVDMGVQLVVEGRLAPDHAPNNIVGRARVSATITMATEEEGYSGTIGWTPRNTGVIGGGAGHGFVGL